MPKETGESTTEEVPYEYYILNVKLTSKPISAVASEILTTEQMEMYQVYRQTMGNKPLLFGGGSPDMSNSEDLTGVQFVNGTRPGNPQLVELAIDQDCEAVSAEIRSSGRAVIPHLFNWKSASVRPGNGSGLHISGRVKLGSHLNVYFFTIFLHSYPLLNKSA